MLLNDFFYIQKLENADGSLKADIRINKSHKIFEGHFPSIPIVPGVCMMQMIKEIMEQQVHQKLMLRDGDNVKFLSVINPTEHSEVQADIQHQKEQDGSIRINASLFAGTIIFFKIKATLVTA
jgi:3-hydroxyacyl-[acyl-carrier-protein] dehydratase